MKITISKGNAKLGAIPSVSLPACSTCNPAAPCFDKCYARRLANFRVHWRDSCSRNLEALRADPVSYWAAVRAAAFGVRFFRYHVSGDIPDLEYLENMAAMADELPHTQFLAFTKQFPIVNAYIAQGGKIPANLKLIFSNWGTWKCENPHHLPTCEVIFKTRPAQSRMTGRSAAEIVARARVAALGAGN